MLHPLGYSNQPGGPRFIGEIPTRIMLQAKSENISPTDFHRFPNKCGAMFGGVLNPTTYSFKGKGRVPRDGNDVLHSFFSPKILLGNPSAKEEKTVGFCPQFC